MPHNDPGPQSPEYLHSEIPGTWNVATEIGELASRNPAVRGLILSAIRQELERDSVVGLRIHRDMTRGTSQSDASGSRLSRDLVLAMVVWRQTPIFAHPAEKRTNTVESPVSVDRIGSITAESMRVAANGGNALVTALLISMSPPFCRAPSTKYYSSQGLCLPGLHVSQHLGA
jgi:hypothetical protein